MLWITIRRKVWDFIFDHPTHAGSIALRNQAKEAGRNTMGLISKWDIREAGRLRDLVPEAFPKKLRTGSLVASQNIHGAWRVDVKEISR